MATKVLVVDDDVQYGELISEVAGLHTLEAITLQEPLKFEACLADYPELELIFLDLHMPGRDGIEVMRVLADQNFAGYIVLMSGFDESVLTTAHELAEEYQLTLLPPLSKPFSIRRVAEIFAQLNLDGKPRAKRNDQNDLSSSTLSKEELLSALEEKRVVMHYQPQVELDGFRVVGVESLVRLLDTDGNICYPGRFVHLAELEGLNKHLTGLVIEQVCQDYQAHFQAFSEMTISINISALDLDSLTFPDELNHKVSGVNLDPSRVIIELTESKAVEQLKKGLDILARLRLKHFQLSIDDFGTGSAVLSNVKKMPFTELKIDKSFVDQILTNQRTEALTEDLINMGHHMKLNLVAEGIECGASMQLLKDMGCDVGQGYYFARPMPAAQLVAWLQENEGNLSAQVASE